MLSMKQAQTPAVSRIVRDERIRAYFEHEGHRTAVSQGALQAHSDPWVGWCSLDGVGQVIKELSPYEADLNWDILSEMDELSRWCAISGARRRRSTASQTSATSTRWWTSTSRPRSAR